MFLGILKWWQQSLKPSTGSFSEQGPGWLHRTHFQKAVPVEEQLFGPLKFWGLLMFRPLICRLLVEDGGGYLISGQNKFSPSSTCCWNLVLKLYQIHLRLDPFEKDKCLQLSVNFSFRMEMRRQREQGNFDYSEKLKKKYVILWNAFGYTQSSFPYSTEYGWRDS